MTSEIDFTPLAGFADFSDDGAWAEAFIATDRERRGLPTHDESALDEMRTWALARNTARILVELARANPALGTDVQFITSLFANAIFHEKEPQ